jgi:sulfonate transport system permease protein
MTPSPARTLHAVAPIATATATDAVPPTSHPPDPPPRTSARPATRPRRTPRLLTLTRIASPLLVVALWQLASATGLLPPDKLAAPSVIVRTAAHLAQTGELGDALLISLRRVAIGVALGLLAGTLAGLITGLHRWGDALLDPILQALRTLPFLGLVPLFILWFGIGETPKIALVTLGMTFPLYLAVHAGIRGTDPGLIEAATVLGFTRWQRIRHVVLPSAVPHAMVGLRQGLGIAWLSIIVGEQINADAGLGYLINNARDFLRTDVIVVGLVIYALLGLLTDALVRLLERRALAWRRTAA